MAVHAVPFMVLRVAATNVSGALDLISQRMNIKHREATAELKKQIVEIAIQAAAEITARQIEAIHEQCAQALDLLAEQAQHFMTQQQEVQAAYSSRTTSRRDRLEFRARLAEIDRELADIRADAQLTYARMCVFLDAACRSGLIVTANLSLPNILSRSVPERS